MNEKYIAEELSSRYNNIPFDSEILDDESIFVSTKLKDDLLIKPYVFSIIAEECGLTYLSISFDVKKKKLKPKYYKLMNDYNNILKTLKMYINTIDDVSYLEISLNSFRKNTNEVDVLNDADYFLETIFETEEESIAILNEILKAI